MQNDWAHCPHYDLGPPDVVGVRICAQCGSAVMVTVKDVPLDEFLANYSTVVAEEGADVTTEVKLYPPTEWR